MRWFGPRSPSNSAPLLVAARTPAEKTEFHIDRYNRAIEQCTKGPERLAQLERERAFWLAVQQAQAGAD